MEAQLERKLRELIDRDEIWQVIQRYGRGLDRMDVELARSCYFPDATDDHGRFVGTRDAFIEWANQCSAAFVSCQHAVLNHYCELDGDDAYTETYYIFTGVAAEPPHLMSTGRYVDHFQRRDGEWRIANRVAVIEKCFELLDDTRWPTIPAALASGDVQPHRRDRSDVSYHRPLRPRSPRNG